ncbi:hypothetical protein [Pseudomonas xanthosomatis]|nr:hypothetical protein [Pseudomonas xanthosomatis]
MFVMPQHRLEVSLTIGLALVIVRIGVVNQWRHKPVPALAQA